MDTEHSIGAAVPKPRTAKQIDASRRNGLRGGRRPKGIDTDRWTDLKARGVSSAEIAHDLGISVRTLHRREADRRELDELF